MNQNEYNADQTWAWDTIVTIPLDGGVGGYMCIDGIPVDYDRDAQVYRPAMPIGQKVICNGYEGVVTEVCDGVLEGMVVVRLARGTVCTGKTTIEAIS